MTSAEDGARIRFGPGGGCFFCRSVHPVVSEVEAVASRQDEGSESVVRTWGGAGGAGGDGVRVSGSVCRHRSHVGCPLPGAGGQVPRYLGT
jgi:hypothetical protein